MKFDIGGLVLLLSLMLACLVMLFLSRISQDPLYHLFADTRSYLGLSNFGDFFSNIGFLGVGIAGLVKLRSLWVEGLFSDRKEVIPFLIFFVAVSFTAPGSAYYHENPDNERLFWDRLPMTVAFMSLFAAILADRVHPLFSGKALWAMVLLGIGSLIYWQQSEAAGVGDLRPYVLVQFYPMIALPLIFWFYPQSTHNPGHTSVKYMAWMYFWYAVAKVLEYFDGVIFLNLGTVVSGHSLKHLAAAIAVYMVVRMLGNISKVSRVLDQ